MRAPQKPLLIKTKDVQRILALSDRQAGRIIRQVRRHFKKNTMQPVTFKEFSQYTGIDLETIYQQLNL
jgi:hypothetical protein